MAKDMDLIEILEKRSLRFRISLGLALIVLIGVVDLLTGYRFSFSLFYVIPVSFAAWLIGRPYAIMTSLASAIVWVIADVASGNVYSSPLILIWNTCIRLSFFIIIALLLSALRSAMERDRELASTDYLTGATNTRLFLSLLQSEIDRLKRYGHPFTLVYFDLDNFKAVNDQFGHLTGDTVLRTIVSYAKRHLRKTDVTARLGGDEFALILPETSEESARVSLTKLHKGLLEEMQQNNWPITFSIGALTCKAAQSEASVLIKMADELSYQVKRGSKNGIIYSTYTGQQYHDLELADSMITSDH